MGPTDHTPATPMLNVHLLPALTTPQALAGKTAIVIDVLRATTTICHACAAGAEVVPVLEVDEAFATAKKLGDEAVIGGERQALPVPGFDLGNSPAEYTAGRVGGRTVVFTSTNGTKAMRHCRQAARVLLSAFVNLSATCDAVVHETDLEIVCAGTENEITREDALLAGAIVVELRRSAPERWQEGNDQAELAADAWRDAVAGLTQRDGLHQALGRSRGARNLLEAGLESDIQLCADVDRFEIVPELHLDDWRIR